MKSDIPRYQILAELDHAEAEANRAIAERRHQDFEVWREVWKILNRISGANRENPFSPESLASERILQDFNEAFRLIKNV